MKSYTDLEQSKKLAEILPIETADMFWADGERPAVWNNKDISLDDTDIPAWSLAALLDILPETIEDKWGEYDLNIDMIYKKPEYVRVCDCHHCDFPSWDWDNEELLDNIVEAVIWLNNNDYLQNEKLY